MLWTVQVAYLQVLEDERTKSPGDDFLQSRENQYQAIYWEERALLYNREQIWDCPVKA